MKYFRLEYDTSKEVGRTYPQLHCTTQFYAHQLSAWRFPSFVPKLEFELSKGGKFTDVLSNAAISAFGILMTDRAKELLSGFKLMNHKYYEAKVTKLKTGETVLINYLHLCDPDLSRQLDYEKSVFYETEWTFRKRKIKINSYDHYNELKSNDKNASFGVDLDKVFVNGNFDKGLDMFVFLPFSGSIYISSKLKEEFDRRQITGVRFEEAPEIA